MTLICYFRTKAMTWMLPRGLCELSRRVPGGQCPGHGRRPSAPRPVWWRHLSPADCPYPSAPPPAGRLLFKKKQDKLFIKITSGKFWNKTLICLALSSPRPWFAATPVPWFSALFGAFSATFYLLDPDPYGGFGSRKSPIIQTRSVLDLHSRITTFENWNRIF